MPSSSSSRTRRSRAPSPEPQPQPSTSAAVFGKLAKGVIEYSVYSLLTKKPSSSSSGSKKSPAARSSTPDMPSKRRPSRSEQSRAFSRERDQTHELVSHLLRGAAALATSQFLKSRKKKKKEKDKADREKKPAYAPAPPPPGPERHLHRERRRQHRHGRPDDASKAELAAAVDSLSAELARVTGQMRHLAGGRRPHRHRDGRCDVYEGLRSCADGLDWRLANLRTGVNNIRNLGVDGPAGRREVVGDPGGGQRGVGVDGRQGSWERKRDPEDQKTKVRTKVEEDRGRKRAREG